MKRRKRKRTVHLEKPRMCDPGMCDHCQYIGEGDFICDRDFSDPEGVLVVSDWEPTENYMRCKKAALIWRCPRERL